MAAKDPLSFFSGECSSSSESESEDNENSAVIPINDKSYYSSTTEQNSTLPSPDTLFATVGKPQFLTSHLQSNKVDWDKLAKSAEDEELELATTGGCYSNVPPPTFEDGGSMQIAAAPVKYTPTEVNSKVLTVSSNAGVGDKRPEEENTDIPTTKKQKKGQLFREKEKRKRDLGMSSRGKNFVEEEKRILRQGFGL